MESKFLGVGLQNGLALALFTMLVIVCCKIIFTKYEVTGLSEVIRSI